jgi:hypothetical protein
VLTKVRKAKAMAKYIYRFRSMDAALHGHHELETQGIHLASPETLNDPMEGYRDVFWQGDVILWRNLFKHYLLCLVRAYEECLWTADNDFEEPAIDGKLTETNLPTDNYRSLVGEAKNLFFLEDRILQLIKFLSDWTAPVSKDQLLFHLSQVHPFAIQAVHEVFSKHVLVGADALRLSPRREVNFGQLHNLIADGNAPVIPHLWEMGAQIISQQNLRLLYNQRTQAPTRTSKKRDWLVLHFPGRYIEALIDSLIHPPWYTACFSGSCDNASMWSTYGDNHRGIALMFQPEGDPPGNLSLMLDGVTGSSFVAGRKPQSAPLFGRTPHQLKNVDYSAGAARIDFFRYIGQLPHSALLRTWWCDESNNISPRVLDIGNDMQKWRSQLWSFLYECAIRKLPDWAYEQEYRIVVPDMTGLRAEHPNLKYDFCSLAGIVFGMRASDNDKVAAIEIVERKCRKNRRMDFQFFQARYSSTLGKLVVSPMSFLKFAQDAEDTPSGSSA